MFDILGSTLRKGLDKHSIYSLCTNAKQQGGDSGGVIHKSEEYDVHIADFTQENIPRPVASAFSSLKFGAFQD